MAEPYVDPAVAEKLASIDSRLLDSAEGRRELCRYDPMLFALTYLSPAITDDDGAISFSEAHLEWFDIARRFAVPSRQPRAERHAFIAPRATGKSTVWFLIIPIWLAAYNHTPFIAAFADTHDQAQEHLKTFKETLKDKANAALRSDFPKLVNAKRNIEGQYIARNGFVFIAKGMDAGSLGMKVGYDRPSVILLDDIEGGEGSYSVAQMQKRLITLQDDILPMNEKAHVVLSGTVTMPGSITHQLIKYNKGMRTEELDWVTVQNFQVHHALPILQNEDGTERSFWPRNSIFTMEAMQPQRHSRSFAKNFLNDPFAIDAEYWRPEDFRYEEFDCTKTILSIDGAVTTGKKSDYTGLAVVGYAPPERTDALNHGPRYGKCLVKYCIGVKLRGNELRNKVLEILTMFPEISGVLVETNMGGDLWLETLHSLPVQIHTLHQSEKKESRAGRALNYYQTPPGYVYHAGRLSALEEQMCAFPNVPNDDLVDAVVNGILMYLRPLKKRRAGVRVRPPR